MSPEPRDPRRTLEELEAARREAERDLEGRLEELRRRVERLRDHGAVAADLAQALEGGGPAELEPLEPAERREPEPPAPPGTDVAPAGLRARLASWLLGEDLRALERRDAAIRHGIARLAAELREIGSGTDAELQRLAERQERLRSELAEGARVQCRTLRVARELLDGVADALAALVDVQEALRELLEAKDSESAVRAAEGPGAKAAVVLEEVRRQQRRILDALVGRRDELQALIDGIQEGRSEAD